MSETPTPTPTVAAPLEDTAPPQPPATVGPDRYRALFDCVADPILVFERPGYRFVECNERAIETYGYSREELLRLSVWDLHLPEDIDQVSASLAQGPEHSKTSRYRHVTKEGKVLDVEVRSASLDGPAGSLTVSIARNVTERIQEEKAARELEAQMQQMQRLNSIGALAGGIAHEFNNQLTVILGNANLIRTGLSDDSADRELLLDIERSAERARDLTAQISAFAGRPAQSRETLSLAKLLSELEKLMETVVAKRARLEIDLDPETPVFRGDASQLKQLILNLVVNASESLPEGRGRIRIRSGTLNADRHYLARAVLAQRLPEGSYVFFEVTDSGSGIAPEVLPHVFDPFYTTKFVGRGLGLSTSIGIVRSHRGAMLVSSQLGEGSTFQVLLPPAARDLEDTTEAE